MNSITMVKVLKSFFCHENINYVIHLSLTQKFAQQLFKD